MGYASPRTCFPSAVDAAGDTCAGLVFGYSGGAAACTGAAVVGSEATYTVRYAPSDGSPAYTANLVQTLQPCAELTAEDGITLAWAFIAFTVLVGSVLVLKKAFA